MHDALLDRISAALAPRPEVLDAYVFGSVARGDTSARSDVDVAVYLDETAPPPSWGHQATILADLMAALGRNDIDLVVLNRAPPLLWREVLRDGVRVLSRDLEATTTREGRALSRWCDWRPVQERIDALLMART